MTAFLSMSCHKQMQPLVSFRGAGNMKPFFRQKNRKAVFVVGPTGTGKSRLAIDLARQFNGEVINCDKIQVFKGLDITTNKVTQEECRGVPHHLLGVIDPNATFTCDDFRHHASLVLESIVSRDRLPIIAGGSNSFIEALANDDPEFRCNYECHFIWVDVALPFLYTFVSERVDRMVESGLIEEVRNMFDPGNADYTQGIRRAIGLPELDPYFRCEVQNIDATTRKKVLNEAIAKIKKNNCKLADRQFQKVQKLQSRWMRNMHRIDATKVFEKSGEEAEEAWQKLVAEPSFIIMGQLLDDHVPPINYIQREPVGVINGSNAAAVVPIHAPAMAAATR